MVPLTNQYWDLVVAHSIAEIAQGRTPNPDMLCNSQVKFGAFREFLAGTFPGRFDRIASGHYAALSRPDGAVGAVGAEAGKANEPDGAGVEGDTNVKLVMSGDAHKAGTDG